MGPGPLAACVRSLTSTHDFDGARVNTGADFGLDPAARACSIPRDLGATVVKVVGHDGRTVRSLENVFVDVNRNSRMLYFESLSCPKPAGLAPPTPLLNC